MFNSDMDNLFITIEKAIYIWYEEKRDKIYQEYKSIEEKHLFLKNLYNDSVNVGYPCGIRKRNISFIKEMD